MRGKVWVPTFGVELLLAFGCSIFSCIDAHIVVSKRSFYRVYRNLQFAQPTLSRFRFVFRAFHSGNGLLHYLYTAYLKVKILANYSQTIGWKNRVVVLKKAKWCEMQVSDRQKRFEWNYMKLHEITVTLKILPIRNPISSPEPKMYFRCRKCIFTTGELHLDVFTYFGYL